MGRYGRAASSLERALRYTAADLDLLTVMLKEYVRVLPATVLRTVQWASIIILLFLVLPNRKILYTLVKKRVDDIGQKTSFIRLAWTGSDWDAGIIPLVPRCPIQESLSGAHNIPKMPRRLVLRCCCKRINCIGGWVWTDPCFRDPDGITISN